MRSRAQTVRLGAFVAIAGALMLFVIVWLSGATYFRDRDRYSITFSETVSGLEIGSAVKLLGVRVGRIESIRVRTEGDDKVEVRVIVDAGTPIRRNATAQLSGSGITGLLFVEITGGTSDAPLIEPGGRITAGESLLGTLTGRAENIAIKTEEVLNRILRVTEDRNIENLGQALDNAQAATMRVRSILESLDGVGERVSAAVQQLTEAANAVYRAGTAVSGVAATTGRAATNLEQITQADGELRQAIAQLQKSLAAAEAVLGGDNAAQMASDVRGAIQSFTKTMNSMSTVLGSSSGDVRDISSTLRDAVEHLEEFARAIREDPSLLIRPTKEN